MRLDRPAQTFMLALLALTGIASAQVQTSVSEGVRVSWQYNPLSSETAERGIGTLDLQLEDAVTGQPLRYQRGQLAAWLRPERHALSDAELGCHEQVRHLASQKITGAAEIDLNRWRLLTFNGDRSLAFINPFVGINNAKLESILTLPGDVDHWALLPRRFQLWVHSRDSDHGRLSLVDTQRRAVTATLDVPAGPAALIKSEDERGLWIVAPDAQQLGWLDAAHPDGAPRWASAPAVVGAIAAETQGVFVWHNGVRSEIQLWQAGPSGQPGSARHWPMPSAILSARWSQQAQRLIVALADGRLAWLDPQSPSERAERILQIAGAESLSAVELFDGGRRLLWLSRDRAQAGAVDVATGRELAVSTVTADADTIAFTGDFAYVHSTRNGKASLLSLTDLRAGQVHPVDISTGRPAPDAPPGLRIAPEPAGQGLLVANPADGVIYQYAEGMMAPSGSFSNYRRSALGLMVLDTALSETAPGRYQVPVRSEQAGTHTLILGGVNPRLAACVSVNLPAALAHAPTAVPHPKASLESLSSPPGAAPLTRTVRVRLEQPLDSGPRVLTGVKDLTLLVFDRRTAWQQRAPMQEASPGLYAATVTMPHVGHYDWLVSSASQNLAFRDAGLGRHDVGKP